MLEERLRSLGSQKDQNILELEEDEVRAGNTGSELTLPDVPDPLLADIVWSPFWLEEAPAAVSSGGNL